MGLIPLEQALEKAKEEGLDLLLVSPDAEPPVCKIINYGQYKYEQNKKEKLARKVNKAHVVKELKMGPKISSNDFDTRARQCTDFLKKGYKVKLTITFRGREIIHADLGHKLIDRFMETIDEVGARDSDVSSAPKALTLMIKGKKA